MHAICHIAGETFISYNIGFLIIFYASRADIVSTACLATLEAGEALAIIWSIRRVAIASTSSSIKFERIFALTDVWCTELKFVLHTPHTLGALESQESQCFETQP